MNKVSLTVLLFLSVPQFLLAQWTTSGSTTSTTNSVGIGTSIATSGLTIQTEGSNVTDGSLFLVRAVNPGFGGFSTIAGIKTVAGDGGEYNFLKLQNAGGTKFLINGSGNVGIGTSTPVTKLHAQVSYDGLNIVGGFQNLAQLETGGTAVGIGFVNEAQGSWWKAAVVHERTGPYGIGSLKFLVNNSIDNSTVTLSDAKMTILASGFVGIGTATPQEALSVNGNIRSKQVKVETDHWPDYVFKKDYQLPSLSEVELYIDKNQHLSEVPTEHQISQDGLNLGEMNKVLLKKVEELTLYLIEQNKKVERQEKRDKVFEARIADLEKSLNKTSK